MHTFQIAPEDCAWTTDSFVLITNTLTNMFKCALISTLAVAVVAFSPSTNVRSTNKSLFMGLIGSGSAKGLAGETAPLGYFDPLGLSTGKTDGDIKVWEFKSYLLLDRITRKIHLYSLTSSPVVDLFKNRNFGRQSSSMVG